MAFRFNKVSILTNGRQPIKFYTLFNVCEFDKMPKSQSRSKTYLLSFPFCLIFDITELKITQQMYLGLIAADPESK